MASLRQRIGAWFSGKQPAPQRRSYAAARKTRLTGSFGAAGNSSADSELSIALSQLRARSRQMVRDSGFAKRAKVVVVNNVIGSGVGMQAQVMNTRGELRKDVNSSVEDAWCEWCCSDSAHTGGTMHFHDIERAAMGQVFEAGEVFIRLHFGKFGDSKVPLSLEMIEAERVPDDITQPNTIANVRMGVEVDKFGRPIAYWVREQYPGDIRFIPDGGIRYERVPAEQMFHLYMVDRAPQTRGEPWMHTAVRKLDDMNEATASELAAVRASSAYFATITSPESINPIVDGEEVDGTPVMDIEPMTIQELKPGEELAFHTPNRPNAGLDTFMRHMQRETAAGMGVSYESLSRDYSQSNYSSSRLALLEDRDTWKVLQLWWIRNFRQPLHKIWLQQAVLSRAVAGVTVEQFALDPSRFSAVLFKPRGWSWIDPTKEVTAYKEAIKAGLTTLTDVIAATADGRDIEDVIETRKRELQMLEDADIEVDTTVVDPLDLAAAKTPSAPASAPSAAMPMDPEEDTAAPARVFPFSKGLQ